MSWRPGLALPRIYIVRCVEPAGQENRIVAHAKRVEREAPLFRADDRIKDRLMVADRCAACGRRHSSVYRDLCSNCIRNRQEVRNRRAKR